MKIKAQQLFSAYEALKSSIRARRDEQMAIPMQAVVQLAMLVTKLEPAYVALIGIRMDLMKRFGDFDKDKNWRAKPEHSDEFLEKWNAALAEEVEVATSQIHTSVLGQGNAYFSVSELLCLTPFLKEDAPSHEPSSSVH